MSKRRCSNCKEYFDSESMITFGDSVQAFHSMECFKEKKYGKKPKQLQSKRRKVTSKVRKQVRHRDHGRCRLCDRHGVTQVHHIVYRSEGGGHGLDNLISLCQSCHEKVHSNKKIYQKQLLGMASQQRGSKMSRHCIYHGGCVDGFTSAWLMRRAYPEIVLHEGSYGDDPPDLGPSDIVFLTDFSYDRKTMIEIAAHVYQVIVLDHHKTAKQNLVELPSNIEVFFDMDKCGSAITLDYLEWAADLKVTPAMKGMVGYVQDYDLWIKALPHTHAINAFIQSSEQNFASWDQIFDSFYPTSYDFLDEMISQGEAILMRDKKVINDIVKTAREITIGGHEVLVAGSPYAYGSTVAGILAEGYRFGAYYVDLPEGRQYGLRSADDGLDVSVIAAFYGGGGHAHASGFKIPWGASLAEA